jgi:hypothetical protein
MLSGSSELALYVYLLSYQNSADSNSVMDCTLNFNNCRSKLIVEDLKEGFMPLAEAQWASDKEAECCKNCEAKFSVSKRKHHCRHCGGIFCNRLRVVDCYHRASKCVLCISAVARTRCHCLRVPSQCECAILVAKYCSSGSLPLPDRKPKSHRFYSHFLTLVFSPSLNDYFVECNIISNRAEIDINYICFVLIHNSCGSSVRSNL